MPYKIAGQPGTWYDPGERKLTIGTIVWRGRLPDGKWTELVTDATDRPGAQRYLREAIQRWHRDRPLPANAQDVTLEKAAQQKKGELHSDAERDRVDQVVRLIGGSLMVSEINQSHVTAAAKAFRKERAAANARAIKEKQQTYPPPTAETINREIVTPLRSVVHFAAEQGWRSWIRLRAVRPEKTEQPRRRPPAARDETVAKLLVAIEEKLAGLRPTRRGRDLNYRRQIASLKALRALVTVVHERGYRISEWLRLEWSTVDLRAARASILVSKPDRWVDFELSPEAVAVLSALEPKTGKVFPWLFRSAVYTAVDKIAPAGVRWRPHESRRAVVTAILKNTGDPRLAQNFVAHASVKTTLLYRVVDPAEVAPEIRRARGRLGRKPPSA